MYGAIFLIFYFVLLRPQQKQRKAHDALVKQLKKGDEIVTAGAEHPIRVHLDPATREPRPYILVRPGLEARISRAVFYELVALAQPETVEPCPPFGLFTLLSYRRAGGA
jgi:hypothetical protein